MTMEGDGLRKGEREVSRDRIFSLFFYAKWMYGYWEVYEQMLEKYLIYLTLAMPTPHALRVRS